MNDIGYIKLHRKILDWQWYGDSSVFKTFITLCLIANHKDGRFLDKKIKRGQVATSIRKLANILDMDKDTVNRCLKCLESSKEIKIKKFAKFSVITIVNYEEYQGVRKFGTDVGTDIGTDVPHNQRSNKNSSFGEDKPLPKREERRGRPVLHFDDK